MKLFMNEDFLLNNDTAKTLYHSYAEKMPVIDYHCHIDPKEIYEDRHFKNITEAWLGADHYKWRLVRAAGFDEEYITGSAPDREKFHAFAEALQGAVGNPLYHWAHLELKRYFGFDGALTSLNADRVYDMCNEKLARDDMSVRGIIARSQVRLICTTDDPADNLKYHKLLRDDDSFNTRVLPAWRPEKAMNPQQAGYADYIEKLSRSADIKIDSLSSLKAALKIRMDFFEAAGCKASDHSLPSSFFADGDEKAAEAVFNKGMAGESISENELKIFTSRIMLYLAGEYARRGWVMQLHMGPVRNVNPTLFGRLGGDVGGDCIGAPADIAGLAAFLGQLEKEKCLPKTVVYSMNPNDNETLESLIGCFQGGSKCRMQHGSAWWFNDTKRGMEQQLSSLASQSMLSGFIGMLTDSRSFLSYTRHEYFRRILCNYIGTLVENGEYPANMDFLGGMVEDISFNNAEKYFEF